MCKVFTMIEMEETGDRSLLEQLLDPFLKNRSSEELLYHKEHGDGSKTHGKVLPATEGKHSLDDYTLETLFFKDVQSQTTGATPSSNVTTRSASICEGDDVESPTNPNSFQRTRSYYYKTFLEQTLNVKCSCNRALQTLEEGKVILEEYLEIKSDPGFGRIHFTQAWVWILKEAIVSLVESIEKRNANKQSFGSYLAELVTDLEDSFRKLSRDSENLQRKFSVVEKEFNNLIQKAEERFVNNMENVKKFEMTTPEHDFFHRYPNYKDSVATTINENATFNDEETNDEENGSVSNHQRLRVRCSVDGVIIKSGLPTCPWLKLAQLSFDRDVQLVLNAFLGAMTEICNKARKTLAVVNELLDRSAKFLTVSVEESNETSVIHPILKLSEILDLPRSAVNFYSREEVLMLFSLKASNKAFDLLKPILEEIMLSTSKQFFMVRSLTHRKKHLIKGHVGARFPKSLKPQAYFEMLIRDTKVNTNVILNRYYNLREVRDLKIQLAQKLSFAPTIVSQVIDNDSVSSEDDLTEIIYQHDIETKAPSTKPTEAMFKPAEGHTGCRSEVIAHSLLDDFESEYIQQTKKLTTYRIVTEDMLHLCSDPIQNFYRSVNTKSQHIEKMLSKMVQASQTLAYTQSSNESQSLENATPISLWVHALCKMLHTWDFHLLPNHIKIQFRQTNEKTMSWIKKLENTLQTLKDNAEQYRTEFYQFQQIFEENHGFCTWICRNFERPSPSEMISSWMQGSTGSKEHTSISDPEHAKVELHFKDFDVTVVENNPEEDSVIELLSLNKVSPGVQTGIVSSFFALIDHIISTTIVLLNCVISIQSKHINVKSLKQALFPNKSADYLKYVPRLEDTILALTFEACGKDIEGITAHTSLLKKFVMEVSQLFQTVQLHLEDKGMLRDNRTDRKTMIERISELEMYDSHAKYLKETIQLLRSAVKAMPKVFVIKAESLTNSYLNWAKVAEKDAAVVATTANVEPSERDDVTVDVSSQYDKDTYTLIDFQQAMMNTTNGNAFFPDPDLFMENIEDWRVVCFDMLAAAVNKFHDLTNEKILESRRALNRPLLCQSRLSKSDAFPAAPFNSIGYTEGICSVLCFITGQLKPIDKLKVTPSQLQEFMAKIMSTTSPLEKFKKAVDSTEKALLNSLSLAVAKAEHKYLPEHLPVLPHDEDFIKNHDLEEMGPVSAEEIEEMLSESKEGSRFVEIVWESIDKKKIFFKSHGGGEDDSSWHEWSQLHITGQLRLIYKLTDQIIQDVWKALVFLQEAKEDIIIAKKLLKKTWAGLGKDLKLKRMPKSSIVVMLKLYRHQVATAVIGLKKVKKTWSEIHYLVTEIIKNGRKWTNESLQENAINPRMKCNVYAMSMENISLRILLHTMDTDQPMLIDTKRIFPTESEEQFVTTLPIIQEIEKEDEFIEVISRVNVKSAVSVFDQRSLLEKASVAITIKSDAKVVHAEVKPDRELFKWADFIENSGLLGLDELIVLLQNEENRANMNSTNKSDLSAILKSLVSVTVDIRVFKELLSKQRLSLLKSLNQLQVKLSQMQTPLEGIASEITRIKKYILELNNNLRAMQDFNGELPSMMDLTVSSCKPVVSSNPVDFIQQVAEDIDGDVWTLACGVSNIGTVIKNVKTLESHAVGNLSLTSKLEIFYSIVGFLEKIVSHGQNMLETCLKQLVTGRKLLKQKLREFNPKGKGILGFMRKKEKNTLNSDEIDEHLICIAKMYQASLKAEKEFDMIYDIFMHANETLRQVYMYIDIKFKLEAPVGTPVVDPDTLRRARNWQNMDAITGMSTPPTTVPPPVILKKLAKKNQREETYQTKYKNAWETKLMELELFFDRFAPKNQITVDIPVVFAPTSYNDADVSLESNSYLAT